MRVFRWVVVFFLIAFAVLMLQAIVATYQSSQHSLFDRWGAGRLAFNLLRLLGEISVVGVALLWHRRAPTILRVLALLVVAVRLGILLVLAGAYWQAIQRWGLSAQTAAVVAGYLAFAPAAVVLVSDFFSARARKSSGD